MTKNQTPVSDDLYDDRAYCTKCGTLVSVCDERCPECGASFRDEEDELVEVA
jgi:RNA polymerase subunit RPABC4/transcription elongation factor Spt4